MPNDHLSQAIKEAYASVPSDEIIHDTLELYHPAFVDDGGDPAPIRVVCDTQDLSAYLEADAPINPGEEVTFIGLPFELELPDVDEQTLGQLVISIDNVSGEITKNIELSMQTPDKIRVIYRPYLSSDLSGPQMNPPLYMYINKIQVGTFRIKASAGFGDIMNKKFPANTYTMEEFPGLVR